jgi:hypothetical protein
MAFSNVNDARTKLKNPEFTQDSQILYANNNLLDSTTIFYTNTAKTILASAGNYVIPTQFKSYFVTLGSDGKIVTDSKKEITDTTGDSTWSGDSNWVSDDIALYSTGEFIPNDALGWARGGTNLQFTSSSSYLITDFWWSASDHQYDHAKKWVIDQGEIVSTALTNIDVSAMKGYDLKLMTGEWYQNDFGKPGSPNIIVGFVGGNTISAIIHIKQEENRVLVVGKVNYYFRPDYFLPLFASEYPSFFKRLPNCLPILDRNGNKKEFMAKTYFLFDMIEKGSGSQNVSKRTYRNPTVDLKGYTLKNNSYFKDTLYGTPPNSNYWMKYEGGATDNIFKLNAYADTHVFEADNMFRSAASATYNYSNSPSTFPGPNDGITDAHKSWVVGLWESLLITDPTQRESWVFSNAYITKTYAQLNPFQWTTAINSGTGYYDSSPANLLRGYFDPTASSGSQRNLNHGKHIQFDYEICAGPGRTSENFGLAMTGIWQSCKNYSIAQNWAALGGVIPTFSNYADSFYLPSYEGTGTGGWRYVDPSVSVATVKTTDLYKDYKEYYVDGTRTLTYNNYYKGAINCYSHFWASDYLKAVVSKWYVYNIIHSYDIQKKIIIGLIGETEAKTKKVCGYSWQYMEDGLGDFGQDRKGATQGNYVEGGVTYPRYSAVSYKQNNPPSHNQTVSVWSFAYMDGLYLWDNNNPIGGEFNHLTVEYTADRLIYGDLFTIDNGAYDWYHIGYWQVMQNKDIVGADTPWLKPELKIDSTTWTSNTDADTTNLPVMLYNQQRPISAYKVSADGTEALLIMTSPFNNGYTKETFTVRLPSKSNQQFDIDVWGNYTTVVRLKGL